MPQHGELALWDETTQQWVGSGIVLDRTGRMLDLNGNSFRTIIVRDENGFRPAIPLIARERAEALELKRTKAISNCAIKFTIDGDGSGGAANQVCPQSSMWFGMAAPGMLGGATSGQLNEKDDRLF